MKTVWPLTVAVQRSAAWANDEMNRRAKQRIKRVQCRGREDFEQEDTEKTENDETSPFDLNKALVQGLQPRGISAMISTLCMVGNETTMYTLTPPCVRRTSITAPVDLVCTGALPSAFFYPRGMADVKLPHKIYVVHPGEGRRGGDRRVTFPNLYPAPCARSELWCGADT